MLKRNRTVKPSHLYSIYHPSFTHHLTNTYSIIHLLFVYHRGFRNYQAFKNIYCWYL